MSKYIDADKLQKSIQKKKLDLSNRQDVTDRQYIEGFNDAIIRVKSIIHQQEVISDEVL